MKTSRTVRTGGRRSESVSRRSKLLSPCCCDDRLPLSQREALSRSVVASEKRKGRRIGVKGRERERERGGVGVGGGERERDRDRDRETD